MIIFDDALALEMTIGKKLGSLIPTLTIVRLSVASQGPCRLGLNRGASSSMVGTVVKC